MASNMQPSGLQPIRPPIGGSSGPHQNFGSPPMMSIHFRPVVPVQPSQQFLPPPFPQFQPVGQNIPVPNPVAPPQSQQLPFQPIQPLPPRPGQSRHVVPPSYAQPSGPMVSGNPPNQQNVQSLNGQFAGLGGPGAPLSSSYTFITSYSQPQNNINATQQSHTAPQIHVPNTPVGVQHWVPFVGHGTSTVVPVSQATHQSSNTASTSVSNLQANAIPSSVDWQEHTSADGRKYYYNKKIRQSSWEKPLELMTPIEISWDIWRI